MRNLNYLNISIKEDEENKNKKNINKYISNKNDNNISNLDDLNATNSIMFNYIKYLKDDFSTKKNKLYYIIEDLQRFKKSQTVKILKLKKFIIRNKSKIFKKT